MIRSIEKTKKYYDKLSSSYDYFAGIFERKYQKKGIELLTLKEGEKVLEIGFGTGYCQKKLAEAIGKTGKVYGIDLSTGMLKATEKRLRKAHLIDRVNLQTGNAVKLPYKNNSFDAVFMSFTLELFSFEEIPIVLKECLRTLKKNGRIVLVTLAKPNKDNFMQKIYMKIHNTFPQYIDCQPIFTEKLLSSAGFQITKSLRLTFFGLSMDIIAAQKN
ncbi:MAG: class I SAM-dependent methyltransferase [Spirochaetia bacterium]|nr:class I SAM-dependent methyltransferase [Spirochaetia bacterium]